VADLKQAAGLAYREAAPTADETGAPVVLVHGFPESSRMWEPFMDALAGAGHRCVAPDLFCLGDSEAPGPATFERNRDAFTAFMNELDLGRVAVVVHDWGGFIGLSWACEHPDLVEALVISDTGFFSDGKWHGLAEGMRSDAGEDLVAQLEKGGFAALLRSDGAQFSGDDIDAYWRPFEEGRGREATLEFFRSMDFEKLAPYDGKLAEMAVPTLLLWGAEDKFAPLAGAQRFEREIPGAELVAIEGAGHFVYETAPERCSRELVRFLGA
jgi:haloalkane dehalogenase